MIYGLLFALLASAAMPHAPQQRYKLSRQAATGDNYAYDVNVLQSAVYRSYLTSQEKEKAAQAPRAFDAVYRITNETSVSFGTEVLQARSPIQTRTTIYALDMDLNAVSESLDGSVISKVERKDQGRDLVGLVFIQEKGADGRTTSLILSGPQSANAKTFVDAYNSYLSQSFGSETEVREAYVGESWTFSEAELKKEFVRSNFPLPDGKMVDFMPSQFTGKVTQKLDKVVSEDGKQIAYMVGEGKVTVEGAAQVKQGAAMEQTWQMQTDYQLVSSAVKYDLQAGRRINSEYSEKYNIRIVRPIPKTEQGDDLLITTIELEVKVSARAR